MEAEGRLAARSRGPCSPCKDISFISRSNAAETRWRGEQSKDASLLMF